ncbi:MAG: hypothetical protein KGL35_21570 [Bradyrhizobium sp.]|nr:hypothetical protein [Bradyrhizobium sp.]
MATWQGLNALSGQTELPKYNPTGAQVAIYTVALTTALANGDTIEGPVIPAGSYLQDIIVDTDQLDSNASATIAFESGYTGHLAAFIASGNTTARAGGIAHANVAGVVGATFPSDTQVLVTLTAGAATAKAGTMRICAVYTASP